MLYEDSENPTIKKQWEFCRLTRQLHELIVKGDASGVEDFLKKHAAAEKDGVKLCDARYSWYTKTLISAMPDFDSLLDPSPLFRAAELGNVDIINILLNHGADPTKTLFRFSGKKISPISPMHAASKSGNPKAVQAFLTHKGFSPSAVVKSPDNTPLHQVLQSFKRTEHPLEDIEIIEMLTYYYATGYNTPSNRPLDILSRTGDTCYSIVLYNSKLDAIHEILSFLYKLKNDISPDSIDISENETFGCCKEDLKEQVSESIYKKLDAIYSALYEFSSSWKRDLEIPQSLTGDINAAYEEMLEYTNSELSSKFPDIKQNPSEKKTLAYLRHFKDNFEDECEAKLDTIHSEMYLLSSLHSFSSFFVLAVSARKQVCYFFSKPLPILSPEYCYEEEESYAAFFTISAILVGTFIIAPSNALVIQATSFGSFALVSELSNYFLESYPIIKTSTDFAINFIYLSLQSELTAREVSSVAEIATYAVSSSLVNSISSKSEVMLPEYAYTESISSVLTLSFMGACMLSAYKANSEYIRVSDINIFGFFNPISVAFGWKEDSSYYEYGNDVFRSDFSLLPRFLLCFTSSAMLDIATRFTLEKGFSLLEWLGMDMAKSEHYPEETADLPEQTLNDLVEPDEVEALGEGA